MWSSARLVAPGDTVIVWLTRDNLQPLVITPGRDFNTKFGNFKQDEFVGVPYGSKVAARNARGFVHLLRPTPELWTLALPHRTQILYLADIAFITSYLHIVPGSTIVEAGTGSASFSHSVARTIGPTGRLFSYEFHETRFGKAKEEFQRHGMDAVRLSHRNVCKDGFTIEDKADAVFLDLPAPWDAVEHAKKALRKDRPTRICCFSPCIEQVLRTVAALNDAGFTEITTYEALLRPHEVFQIPPLPSVAPLSAKLKQSEVRREEKRQRQIAANKAAAEALAASAGDKRKHPAKEAEEDAETKSHDEPDPAPKRQKTDTMDVAGSSTVLTPVAFSSSVPESQPPQERVRVNVAKALAEVRGHTSYLTFAILAPRPAGMADSTAVSDLSTPNNLNKAEDSAPLSSADAEMESSASTMASAVAAANLLLS